ncbi:hypothetical protein ZIOFF_038868 [Zingiber officinale]|uniref:Uncharacterized protein n=1 Tax=Zingiber officinale TaxID=94328 RepID=A0A8J5GF72_ZINOF|nr:hypothetical protein ZIOFF_038868 [Zingiber officinale]
MCSGKSVDVFRRTTREVGKEEEERKQATAGGESDALLGEQKHHGGEQDSEAESCAPDTGEHSLALPPRASLLKKHTVESSTNKMPQIAMDIFHR